MRTVGIIAEYNPFHTGHAYHITRAKELSGADYAVVVMSPDFVQRGEPAVFDKYTRARMALTGGADLVLELPVCFATGSAEYFAEGAIALLDIIGVTDVLCFGAESDDLTLFSQTADVLLEEPEDFVQELRALQKSGSTYPQARSAALSDYISRRTARTVNFIQNAKYSGSFEKSAPLPDAGRDTASLSEFLSSPNNILGIEYCKALKKRGSRITPLPLLRKGSGYHSTALADTYCSATAIRTAIRDGSAVDCLPYLPQDCRELFLDGCRIPMVSDDFMACLIPKLLARDTFDDILDITPDLSDRIRSQRSACIGFSFEEAVSLLKTRQITQARVRRALLHLLLEIRTDETEYFRTKCAAPYAKVLGFRRTASPLLRAVKENGSIPLITKNTKARTILDARAMKMWEQDLSASHLYRGIRSNRYHLPFRTEYELSPVILP